LFVGELALITPHAKPTKARIGRPTITKVPFRKVPKKKKFYNHI
jgi:hypothetical protein